MVIGRQSETTMPIALVLDASRCWHDSMGVGYGCPGWERLFQMSHIFEGSAHNAVGRPFQGREVAQVDDLACTWARQEGICTSHHSHHSLVWHITILATRHSPKFPASPLRSLP